MYNNVSPKSFVNFVTFINSFLKVFNGIKYISLDIIMTLGPAVNYIFQAMKFHKTKSSIGFSNYICLITMMAHTTKIFFWFGKRFVITLLFQSILVILIQLYIIYLSVKYKKKTERDSFTLLISRKKKTVCKKIKNWFFELFDFSKTFKFKLIWKWDKTIEFYKFYFSIVASLTILLFIFGIKNKIYANAIGYINIVMELLCSLPQIIELYRTKNQRNLSKLMVILWLIGNLVKIYYNYYNKSPLQLLLGAAIQVFFNIILIGQIIYYYRINEKENLYEDVNINDKDKEKEANAKKNNRRVEKLVHIKLSVKEKIDKESETDAETEKDNVEESNKKEEKENKKEKSEIIEIKEKTKMAIAISSYKRKKEEYIKKEEEMKKDESDDDIMENNKHSKNKRVIKINLL